MCSYCGCESITVIGKYMAEHESIVNVAGTLRRAAASGDVSATATAVHALGELLQPHTRSEERSLFKELRAEPDLRDHVDQLCREHQQIDDGLSRVAEGDLVAAVPLLQLLRQHIDKEENGLFPAAAIALDGPAWERVTARA